VYQNRILSVNTLLKSPSCFHLFVHGLLCFWLQTIYLHIKLRYQHLWFVILSNKVKYFDTKVPAIIFINRKVNRFYLTANQIARLNIPKHIKGQSHVKELMRHSWSSDGCCWVDPQCCTSAHTWRGGGQGMSRGSKEC